MLLGFVLGIRHAADPDHVAAIAALVARHRRAASRPRSAPRGALGHSLTILAVGGVLVALRIAVPASLAIGAELLVAAILVVLGIANLRALRPCARRAHPHAATPHAHGRPDGAARLRHRHRARTRRQRGRRDCSRSRRCRRPQTAVVYLAVFGVGTVGGMVALSFALGIPLRSRTDTPLISRWVLGGSGALSICAGIYLGALHRRVHRPL